MSAFEHNVRQAILNHYEGQRGGAAPTYPVFKGPQFQYGAGIGDIFRSIGRFLFPVISSSAKSFISSAAKGLSEGKSLKEAAKGAIHPTFSGAAEETGSQLKERLTGAGRRRRRRRASKRRRPHKAARTHSPVYKGAGRKRKSHRKIHHKFKRVRFLPTNF